MIKKALLAEFQHEAENTKKLLSMIPNDALSYRPQPHLWSVGEFAAHIAEIYNWYQVTFNKDSFEMSTYTYDKGDISKTTNILKKLENNIKIAQQAIENFNESEYMNDWSMTINGVNSFPPMPKAQVIRGFLFNHLYHHRGELIAHLRATGNQVPSLYGPNYEESQAIM
ncbi:DinB family protein [Aestuariibaculum sediminum]|uniref:DinB family protein n=1 Tax=Aestuariibaculum sediminum TaxID=2770637 RepID=A0A8J6UE03_9FLAO|nr:DinB family protein [Aestuariibaculum sediminum]MBD0833429.1 DinB family protein [Aestuariibaculum sediminum]